MARICRNILFLLHIFLWDLSIFACRTALRYLERCCLLNHLIAICLGESHTVEKWWRSFPIIRPSWPVLPISRWHIPAWFLVFYWTFSECYIFSFKNTFKKFFYFPFSKNTFFWWQEATSPMGSVLMSTILILRQKIMFCAIYSKTTVP